MRSGWIGVVSLPERYLVGAGGAPSLGEELTCRTWIDYLAERFPGERIVLATPNASNSGSFHAGSGAALVTTSLFADLVSRSERRATSLAGRAEWIERKVNRLGTPEWDIAIARLTSHARSIHFIGGDYLSDADRLSCLSLAAATAASGERRIRLYATGLDLRSLPEGPAAWLRHQLADLDAAESRDVLSSAVGGIQSGVDDLWLALRPGAGTLRRMRGAPRVMVNLQHDYTEQERHALLAATVQAIRGLPDYRETVEIGVAETQPPDDAWAQRELAELLPNPVRLFTFQRLWELGLPADESTVWITTRFHTHLLGAALGAQGIVLTVGGAQRGEAHRSLLDLPTGWSLVDVSRGATDELLLPGRNPRFPRIVKELAAHKRATADALYPRHPEWSGSAPSAFAQPSLSPSVGWLGATRPAAVSPRLGGTAAGEPLARQKVFVGVVTHTSAWTPSAEGYFPVVVGRDRAAVQLETSQPIFHDDTGRQIARKNRHYCELTAQYWIWQNVAAEVKGLVHYRRYLQSPRRRGVLDQTELLATLEDVDVIVPRQWTVEGSGLVNIPKTVVNQYGKSHAAGDLLETLATIEEFHPEYRDAFFSVMRGDRYSLGNIMIARAAVFDAYSEWLFDILSRVEKRWDASQYKTRYQQRVFGFLSERLLAVWLEHHCSLAVRRLKVYRSDQVPTSQ